MALDHLAVSRLELDNFGERVTVATPGGPVFPVQMLIDENVEPTSLGNRRGHLAEIEVRCLPEDAEEIGRGATLTRSSGEEFRVVDVLPVLGAMTQILVNR